MLPCLLRKLKTFYYEYYSSSNQKSSFSSSSYYKKGTFEKVVTKENLKKFWCRDIKGVVEPTLLISESDAKKNPHITQATRMSYKRSFDLFFKYSMNLPVMMSSENDDETTRTKYSIDEIISETARKHEQEEEEWRMEHDKNLDRQQENDKKFLDASALHERRRKSEKDRDEQAEHRLKIKSEVSHIPKHVKFNYDLLDMSFWAMLISMREDPTKEVLEFL